MPKEEKDPLNPSFYRPISLLGADVKILVEILASRLQRIQKCIHPDQSGFIPSRATSIKQTGISKFENSDDEYRIKSHTIIRRN